MATGKGGEQNIGKGNDRVDETKRVEANAHDALLATVHQATIGKAPVDAAVQAIGKMSTAEIKDLSTEDISKFSPKMVGALKPERIAEMTSTQIGAFTPEQRAVMSPEQNKAALGVMVNSINEKLSRLGDDGHSVLADNRNSSILSYVADASKMDPERALAKMQKAVG